ncbi:MAG: hypothetical protein BIFFINMI_02087 [Phycisphaerae bacterium]|nr:hypothetical protein [Phycisphaerae bacterium]
MSDPLRIALVAEGPTDRIVIQAALQSLLEDRPFVIQQLQPEGSVAFGPLGAGWTGVYRWCKQAAVRGSGRLSQDALLFENHDLLLLHLDADVADKKYSDDSSLDPEPEDGKLPCKRPCPPAGNTTDALRAVLLSWCGEVASPAKAVICMPSKSTEAWVVASLFPNDRIMQRAGECLPNPESRLGQQPKRIRIRKSQRDYLDHQARLEDAWPRVAGRFGEAKRFEVEFLVALKGLPG